MGMALESAKVRMGIQLSADWPAPGPGPPFRPPVELEVKLAPGAKTAGGEEKLLISPGCSCCILCLILLCFLVKLMTCLSIKAYSARAPKTNSMQANNQISRAVTWLATGMRALKKQNQDYSFSMPDDG